MATKVTTISTSEVRRKVVQAQVIQPSQKQLKELAQRYMDIAYGYACFFFVAGFLVVPLLVEVAIILYFGLLHGVLFALTAAAYNYLEEKYHPSGLIGRRWPWFNDAIGRVYKNFEDIMPLRVIKLGADDEYKSPRKLLFCFHPHGVLFLGPSGLALRWSSHFPGLKCSHLMSGMIFIAPIFRYFCLWIGGIPVTRAAAKVAVEQHGSSLSLIPGGLAEMLQADARPRSLEPWETENARVCGDEDKCCGANVSFADEERKTVILYLLNRKGFIKLALQLGLDLVPVFTFGEIENYKQMRWGMRWRLKFSRMVKLPFTMVWGKYGVFPYLKPISVIVSKPIPVEKDENPSQEKIDELHKIYLDKLCSLFEENKVKYGYPDARLVLM